MRILLISLSLALLGACGFVGFPGVYKIDVEQGNIVTQEMADQLKPGMNRRQVRFVLGTPLVEDTFNANRWDYLYVKRNGMKVLTESRLTVNFDGEGGFWVYGKVVPAAARTAPWVVELAQPPWLSWLPQMPLDGQELYCWVSGASSKT